MAAGVTRPRSDSTRILLGLRRSGIVVRVIGSLVRCRWCAEMSHWKLKTASSLGHGGTEGVHAGGRLCVVVAETATCWKALAASAAVELEGMQHQRGRMVVDR